MGNRLATGGFLGRSCAMGFASCARWGLCRAAHCSPFLRNINVSIKMHRGLAASPLLRLAAEQRPLAGFAEQGGLIPGNAGSAIMGEAVDETVDAAVAVAAILDGLTDGNAVNRCLLETLQHRLSD